jgi:hypothetical protein
MLAGGLPLVKLEELADRESVERCVSGYFENVQSKADLKKSLGSPDHLWILYLILRTWSSPAVMTIAMSSLARCIARITASKKKKSASGDRPQSTEVLARILAGKVSQKPALSKGFTEVLSSAQSLIALSWELSNDILRKEGQIRALTATEAATKAELQIAKSDRQQLEANVSTAQGKIGNLEKQLGDEQQHFERQRGINEEQRKKLRSDLMADLRRACTQRLQNIRLFADRSEPNKDGIIRLVGEIEEAIKELSQQ